MKYQNIPQENWDNLIILDACRYDIFEKTYAEYLNGKLEKRKSKGSYTAEWLVKTFPDQYEIVYLSSNPHINSIGFSLNETHPGWTQTWNPKNHFSKIIDVWDFGWDEEAKTVFPEELKKEYLRNKEEYKSEKTILHFMQPHLPFLSMKGRSSLGGLKRNFSSKDKSDTNFLLKKGFLIHDKLAESLGRENLWRIKRILPDSYIGDLERAWREDGKRGIFHYYEENLRRALKVVSELLSKTGGRTIVTTDHGEAFGEQGIWHHPKNKNLPVLKEVPWLVVET